MHFPCSYLLKLFICDLKIVNKNTNLLHDHKHISALKVNILIYTKTGLSSLSCKKETLVEWVHYEDPQE